MAGEAARADGVRAAAMAHLRLCSESWKCAKPFFFFEIFLSLEIAQA
jgi:hypothetical protein